MRHARHYRIPGCWRIATVSWADERLRQAHPTPPGSLARGPVDQATATGVPPSEVCPSASTIVTVALAGL
jgi:hypothetical protein